PASTRPPMIRTRENLPRAICPLVLDRAAPLDPSVAIQAAPVPPQSSHPPPCPPLLDYSLKRRFQILLKLGKNAREQVDSHIGACDGMRLARIDLQIVRN